MTPPQAARHSLPTLVVCLSVLRASGGCHFSDREADAADGCLTYARGTCGALARCGPLFLTSYGSYEACEAELSEQCAVSLRLPDVFGSGDGAARCGEQMQYASCDAIANGELPSSCGTPQGPRSDGAPCRVGAQCASGRCAKNEGDWGVCRERLWPGETCVDSFDCDKGLYCSVARTCVPLGREGESCSGIRLCRAPLACVAGTCAAIDPVPTCVIFADILCAQLDRCSAPLVRSVYGDVRSCGARNALRCTASLGQGDPVLIGAAIAGCTAALDDVGCEGLIDHGLPAACQLVPGPRADGQPCNSPTQCASTRCAYAQGAACGSCAPLGAVGAACAADSDCVVGAVCGGGACRVPGALGASCDAAQRCAYPWSCVAGRCDEGAGPGAACSLVADACDRYRGLACSAAGRCEPWRVGAPGQACNLTPSGWVTCGGGSSCVETREGAGCAGPLADGQACTAGGAPNCLAPAECLGGICRFASEVQCP